MREHSTPYHIYIALDILCGCASILNLTIISLERMYAVNSPAKHRNISRNKALIFGAVVFVWCYSIFLAALHPLKVNHGFKDYTLFIVILAFILPTLVIIASYMTIFYMVKSRDMQGRRLQREIKLAGMIGIVILLFLLCWFPFFLLNMLFDYCPCRESISYRLIPWVKYFHYTNSTMNPVIYAYRNTDYRSAFKRILYRGFLCSKGSGRERSTSVRSYTQSYGYTERDDVYSFSPHDVEQTSRETSNVEVHFNGFAPQDTDQENLEKQGLMLKYAEPHKSGISQFQQGLNSVSRNLNSVTNSSDVCEFPPRKAKSVSFSTDSTDISDARTNSKNSKDDELWPCTGTSSVSCVTDTPDFRESKVTSRKGTIVSIISEDWCDPDRSKRSNIRKSSTGSDSARCDQTTSEKDRYFMGRASFVSNLDDETDESDTCQLIPVNGNLDLPLTESNVSKFNAHPCNCKSNFTARTTGMSKSGTDVAYYKHSNLNGSVDASQSRSNEPINKDTQVFLEADFSDLPDFKRSPRPRKDTELTFLTDSSDVSEYKKSLRLRNDTELSSLTDSIDSFESVTDSGDVPKIHLMSEDLSMSNCHHRISTFLKGNGELHDIPDVEEAEHETAFHELPKMFVTPI